MRLVRWVVLIPFFVSTALAWGADSARSQHRVGLIATGNGGPAPSLMGIGLGWNVTEFLRLQGGIGTYNRSIANTPRYLANYTAVPVAYGVVWAAYATVRPLLYSLAWLGDSFTRFIKTGKVSKHLTYKEFMEAPHFGEMKVPYLADRSISTLGGGPQLLVPGWTLSPLVGVDWARIKTREHPYGFPDQMTHIYFTAGADWQSSNGLNLAAGAHLCPRITYASACGAFVNLGYFF